MLIFQDSAGQLINRQTEVFVVGDGSCGLGLAKQTAQGYPCPCTPGQTAGIIAKTLNNPRAYCKLEFEVTAQKVGGKTQCRYRFIKATATRRGVGNRWQRFRFPHIIPEFQLCTYNILCHVTRARAGDSSVVVTTTIKYIPHGFCMHGGVPK